MTLADNARGLQGTDSSEAIVAMAAGFGRESALMADMGLDAAALDALVKQAGDAVIEAGMLDASAAFGALPDGDKPPFQQMTFTLHDSQAEVVRKALDAAKAGGSFDDSPNENSNGNALARIAKAYL
jgi:Tfp pilus assembly PilM family ATPase